MRKRPMPTGRQEGRRIHARARLEIVPFVKLTPEIVPTSTPEGLEYAPIRDALPTVSRYAWSRHGSGRESDGGSAKGLLSQSKFNEGNLRGRHGGSMSGRMFLLPVTTAETGINGINIPLEALSCYWILLSRQHA
jgi:hypothetical protein